MHVGPGEFRQLKFYFVLLHVTGRNNYILVLALANRGPCSISGVTTKYVNFDSELQYCCCCAWEGRCIFIGPDILHPVIGTDKCCMKLHVLR